MDCTECRALLHAYVDDELDVLHQLEMDEHLRRCVPCSKAYQGQLALRSKIKASGLYLKAPAAFEQRLQTTVRRRTPRTPWRFSVTWPEWIAGAAAAAALVILGVVAWAMLSRPPASERIEQDVVTAHIRSLMPGHLTDVPSSDQHTVKPWFAGKLDFSPPVADLSREGFALTGGRLDYAADRPVAALVYRRGSHVINLLVWPSPAVSDSPATTGTRQGYNVVHWTRGQTTFWAISDLNLTELQSFARLVQDQTP